MTTFIFKCQYCHKEFKVSSKEGSRKRKFCNRKCFHAFIYVSPERKKEKHRLAEKRRRLLKPKEYVKASRKWQQANPHLVRALETKRRKRRAINDVVCQKTNLAIRTGKIKPEPCIICKKKDGKLVKAQAHHCDYKQPLKIMWLCPRHHKAWHRVFIPDKP